METNSLVQINEGLVLAALVLAWAVYRIIRSLALRKVDLVREGLLNLAFLYGWFVFRVTFFPMIIVLYAFDPHSSNLIPLVGIIRMIQHGSAPVIVRNLVGNLVLLAPLGFLLPAFFKPVRRVEKMLGIGFLVSLGIELTQLLLKVRIFDVDDLILNTLGVLIGFSALLLLSKLSILSRLLARLSGQVRKGQAKGFIAYGLVALLAFLAIYSYQIMRQTETRTAIVDTLPSRQQTLLGTPRFGEFMFVFSQSDQGDKSYALYRRVFFNRYTLLQWGDLSLDGNVYTVSAMSTGQAMNYFVIARSREEAVAMTSEELRFPLVQVGEYYFSYARLPLNQPDRYLSFRFLDPQGNELGLSMAQ